jgi:hypothetical protein
VESCGVLSFFFFWAGDYYFDTYAGGEESSVRVQSSSSLTGNGKEFTT